jgi:hypothetical protein
VTSLPNWSTYLLWYLAIGAGLLIVALVAVQIKKRLFPSFAQKLLDATQPTDKPQPTLASIKELLVGICLVVPLWPVAIGVLIHDRWNSRHAYRWTGEEQDRPDLRFNAYGGLIAKVSVAQAEADNIILDPHCPAEPFGHLHHGWLRFLARQPEGGELWSFEREVRDSLFQGYAWVIDGQIQSEFTAYG